MNFYKLRFAEYKKYKDVLFYSKNDSEKILLTGKLSDLFSERYKKQTVSNIDLDLSLFSLKRYEFNKEGFHKYLYDYEIKMVRKLYDNSLVEDYFKTLVNTDLLLEEKDIKKIDCDFFEKYKYNKNYIVGMDIISKDFIEYNFYENAYEKHPYDEYIFVRANEDDNLLDVFVRNKEVEKELIK